MKFLLIVFLAFSLSNTVFSTYIADIHELLEQKKYGDLFHFLEPTPSYHIQEEKQAIVNVIFKLITINPSDCSFKIKLLERFLSNGYNRFINTMIEYKQEIFTPLAYALMYSDFEISKLLINQGALVNLASGSIQHGSNLLGEFSGAYDTPFHIACKLNTSKKLQNALGEIDFLLERGADPFLENCFGITPFHYFILTAPLILSFSDNEPFDYSRLMVLNACILFIVNKMLVRADRANIAYFFTKTVRFPFSSIAKSYTLAPDSADEIIEINGISAWGRLIFNIVHCNFNISRYEKFKTNQCDYKKCSYVTTLQFLRSMIVNFLCFLNEKAIVDQEESRKLIQLITDIKVQINYEQQVQ